MSCSAGKISLQALVSTLECVYLICGEHACGKEAWKSFNAVLIFPCTVFLLGCQDIRLLLEVCERENIDQESSLYNEVIKSFTLEKTSACFLSTCRDGDSDASLGSQYQFFLTMATRNMQVFIGISGSSIPVAKLSNTFLRLLGFPWVSYCPAAPQPFSISSGTASPWRAWKHSQHGPTLNKLFTGCQGQLRPLFRSSFPD